MEGRYGHEKAQKTPKTGGHRSVICPVAPFSSRERGGQNGGQAWKYFW
jgi:hypothetical protein